MLKCWQELPTKRPTFEELVKEFDAMLVSLSDSVSSKLLLIRQSIIYGCGLSERLYEKKINPFSRAKSARMVYLSRLNRDDPAGRAIVPVYMENSWPGLEGVHLVLHLNPLPIMSFSTVSKTTRASFIGKNKVDFLHVLTANAFTR